MSVAAKPSQAAENADLVLSIVTDGSAVKAVAFRPEGIIHGLSPKAVYLDMGTTVPEVSREVSPAFKE
jgi:3-hydroxyisobutyrate dehydrogenase-like beta-hydroxyacid dehydrogenase